MVMSVHPRTADKLSRFGLTPSPEKVRLVPPLGFCDFACFEKNAFCESE